MMHKKKKLAVVVTAVVVLSLGVVGLYSTKQSKEESLEPKVKGNMIAMYLEDENGEYKLSSSKEFPKEGYVLNLEKSTCTNGGVLSQDSETKLISLRTSNSSKCDLYFEKEKSSSSNLIAKANPETITNYTDGDTKEMYAFSHLATAQTETLTDYRYIGANPNNWIRFNDEDWRIIGVFTVETESKGKLQLIKIIRNESIGGISWDDYTNGSSSNEWSTASLKSLLNGEYYNTEKSFSHTNKWSNNSSNIITIPKGLNTLARNQIESVKWYLGGISTNIEMSASKYYESERSTKTYQDSRTTNIIQKIGLMYPSDYVYTYGKGVDEKCYTDGFNCRTDQGGTPSAGWLYYSHAQQTQAPSTSSSSYAFSVYENGSVLGSHVENSAFVRPTVYLKSDIKITGGDGSQGNAYTIE